MKLLEKLNRVYSNYRLIVVLLVLGSFGVYKEGISNTIPQVLTAVIAASILDLFIKYWKKKIWKFPSDAVITGLLVSMTLQSGIALYIPLTGAVLAIFSKHLIRVWNKKVFNPAVFGIGSVILIYGTYTTWWWTWVTQFSFLVYVIPLLLIIYMIKIVGRIYIAASFLVTHIILSFTYHLYGIFHSVALSANYVYSEILIAIIFFIMVCEPKTTPITKKGGIIFGVLLAIFILFYRATNLDFFIFGLLTTNIFGIFVRKYIG